MNSFVGLICGVIFGVGLAVSGMTDTNKVLGFLDVFGQWRPELAFVMGAAVLVTLLGFPVVRRQYRPLFAPTFDLPSARNIDARLLTGAALFGVGWGLYGYCPGPALTAVIYGERDTLLFLIAMIVGMAVAARIPRV